MEDLGNKPHSIDLEIEIYLLRHIKVQPRLLMMILKCVKPQYIESYHLDIRIKFLV